MTIKRSQQNSAHIPKVRKRPANIPINWERKVNIVKVNPTSVAIETGLMPVSMAVRGFTALQNAVYWVFERIAPLHRHEDVNDGERSFTYPIYNAKPQFRNTERLQSMSNEIEIMSEGDIDD